MKLTTKQLVYIQQAIWKIEAADKLVAHSLGGTAAGDEYSTRFEALMDELIGDLAESSEVVDG